MSLPKFYLSKWHISNYYFDLDWYINLVKQAIALDEVNFLDIAMFLQFSGSLFLMGLWGILAVRNNIIIMLISLELMLFSCTLNFVFFAYVHDDILCQVFSFLILTVAAAESSLGLAILILYYRLKQSTEVDFIIALKGLARLVH